MHYWPLTEQPFVFLPKIAVLFSQHTKLSSHFTDKLEVLELQLLDLFVLLPVQIGHLDLQLLGTQTLPHLGFVLLDDQPFQLLLLLTLGSSKGLLQLLNLYIFFTQLCPSGKAFILSAKGLEVVFQANYEFLMLRIFSVSIIEFLEDGSVLFSELIVLKFQFLASVLFDNAPQLLETVLSLIEVTLIDRGDFLKFLQFFGSSLLLINQVRILALQLIDLLQFCLQLLLERSHSLFEHFLRLLLLVESSLKVSHHNVILHLVILITLGLLRLPLPCLGRRGRPSLEAVHLISPLYGTSPQWF